MSKGSQRRPRQISREREDLQYAYAYGDITKEEYEKQKQELDIKEGRA